MDDTTYKPLYSAVKPMAAGIGVMPVIPRIEAGLADFNSNALIYYRPEIVVIM